MEGCRVKFQHRKIMSILCLVNLSFIFCSTCCPLFPEATQNESLGLLKYEVNDVYVGSLKHVIRIINSSPTTVKGELIVPLVKNETARHYVILQNTSLSKVNDSCGNMYLYMDDLTIGGGQVFRLELNYYVLSFSIQYLIDLSIVGNCDVNSEIYKKYTRPEQLIESNDSRMISLMHNLTDNIDDWHEKVLRIYNFAYSHINYEVQDEEMGALWALENRVGDCSEYSYLFVALCRAARIPARIQAGFAFHRSSETLEDGHMWAEYYLKNYGWIPVDVAWQLFDRIDDKHFSSIQSTPEVIPYANYIFDCKAEENNVEDEQLVSLRPCSTNVFDDSFAGNVARTVREKEQAKCTIFLGNILGTHLIFPSEVNRAEETLLEVEIQLQNAVDFWDENPKIAKLNAVNALRNIEETLQNAWMLIVKAFVIFISISIAIMLIASFFLKRIQIKHDRISA